MKLTIALLLATCLQVSAKTFSQTRITLSLQSVELRKALVIIEKKSNYRFLYNDDVVVSGIKVDVEAANTPVTEVLDKLLRTRALFYKVLENNLIVISAADNSAIQETKIAGRIVSGTGEPLVGVSVKVKGSSLGTQTDLDGRFTLTVPDNAVLLVSYVGYDAQEVPVAGKTDISITLHQSEKVLEQVVVVGYGTQRKLDVTGSVAQIKGDEISKQSVVNPISGLQGKVAGVQITNSGAPGASPQITIRGTGTVYGNITPLYVVDGVWYDDINFLNPSDIEDISVLKDASSEAIYGIRAANGVVLITTRKGKRGEPTVNYNGYVGWQHASHMLKMADGTQYATLLNEKNIYSGLDTMFSNPASFGKGTDWYRQILRDAFTTNHQVSLSGSTTKSSYNFSVGYLEQQGLVKTNDFQRYTAHLQNDYTISKFVKLGYTATGSAGKSTDIYSSIFNQIFNAAPIVPVRYASGAYGDPADYGLGNAVSNPQVTLDFFNQNTKTYRATGNAYIDIRFAKHFTLHSSIGGDYAQAEVRNYNPVYQATINQLNARSLLTISRVETRNYLLENTLTYQNTFGDHRLTVLAAQTAQRYKSYGISGTAKDVPYSSSGDLYLALGSAGNSNVTDYGDLSTVASYFGRVNYSFKNRYLINASIRADGSSKFSGDQRWGYFPSVGAGWVISEEPFMQDQHIFNTLKLRGSWGKIGNASVPTNTSVLTVAQTAQMIAFLGQPSLPYTGASINTIVPPTTYWERGEGTDIGLEAAVLQNRLTITADFYNKKTRQAIFDIPILYSLGTIGNNIIANQADFQNQGFELALSWNGKIGKDWSYSISANGSMNDNKVLSVVTGGTPIYAGGGGATSGQYTTRTVAGRPIGEFFGQQVIGIFQTTAEVNSYTSKSGQIIQPNARPGDFKYADTNGDGTIDGKDRVTLGNPNPKYTYGINTNWTYKAFDLTLDFQGVAKVSLYNAQQGLRFGNENYTEDFWKNRWHGAGTSNSYPSADIVGRDNYIPNSWFVQSGSYFRVRTIQLGYSLPAAMLSRWKLQKVRIFLNAQNAFTFFKYKGFNPEVLMTARPATTSTTISTNTTIGVPQGSPTNAGIDTN
ncbi:MAG: SusC/RagA family TonB-linked outer membrane protein, partial [Bacteroidetes bacterium]|nr:SusC/RagA family TonB-linked outer membrane protein [Bacteroidota bacterium]